MTHWKQLTDRKYLFAFDLNGKDVTLTIDRIEGGELEGEKGRKTKKPLCYFRESKSGKPLALNATNSKAIAKLCGSDQIEDWAGVRITIYPTTTEMGGETVPCIRVRPRKPGPARGAQHDPLAAAHGAGQSLQGQTEPTDTMGTRNRDVSDAGDPEPPEPGSAG